MNHGILKLLEMRARLSHNGFPTPVTVMTTRVMTMMMIIMMMMRRRRRMTATSRATSLWSTVTRRERVRTSGGKTAEPIIDSSEPKAQSVCHMMIMSVCCTIKFRLGLHADNYRAGLRCQLDDAPSQTNAFKIRRVKPPRSARHSH
jgi:hypothetical protein